MLSKLLTNFIILTLVVLPVQVISAGIENSSMQMQMSKMSQADSNCMHNQAADLSEENKQSTEKSCCSKHSNQCKSCNNCPQVANAVVLTTPNQTIHPTFKKERLSNSHLLVNGTSQKNLLRPPRTLI